MGALKYYLEVTFFHVYKLIKDPKYFFVLVSRVCNFLRILYYRLYHSYRSIFLFVFLYYCVMWLFGFILLGLSFESKINFYDPATVYALGTIDLHDYTM